MSYLERLRRRSLEKQALIGLTKPTEDQPVPVVRSWQGSLAGSRPSEKWALDEPTELTEGSVGSVGSLQSHFSGLDIAKRAAISEWDGSAPTILVEALAQMHARPWPAWCDDARWQFIIDVFAGIIDDGTAAQALALGWQLAELIGVQKDKPHGLPLRAGLVFSLREGDQVKEVQQTHCRIHAGRDSHLWLRVPLPSDGSVLMPWALGKM